MSDKLMTNSELTIIVTASPIEAHPSTELIETTIDSLELLGLAPETKILLVHDACPPNGSLEQLRKYSDYLEALSRRYAERSDIEIHLLNDWGCLSGVVKYAVELVETDFVLVMQHDMAFKVELPVRDICSAMRIDEKIRHVRFNKRSNLPVNCDGSSSERIEFFGKSVAGSMVPLVTTLCWSDNNHLVNTDHYRRFILPLVGKKPTFMEQVVNRYVSRKSHKFFGTYLYGELGSPATVKHLDGRGSRLRFDGQSKPLFSSLLTSFLFRTRIGFFSRSIRLYLFSTIYRFNLNLRFIGDRVSGHRVTIRL